MTHIAGVRNLQRIGLAWRDKVERVTSHIHVGDSLFDLRHMTRDTFAPRAADLVMRVLLNAGRMGTVLRVRSVTRQAYLLYRLS